MAADATRPFPPARPATGTPIGGLARAARAVVLVLLVGLTAGGMAQFFLAGLSVFDTPSHWPTHATTGSALGALANLVWIFAALGRVGWRLVLGTLLLPVLFALQHVFPAMDSPGVRALHPLNGALIFALTLWLLVRTVALLRRPSSIPTA